MSNIVTDTTEHAAELRTVHDDWRTILSIPVHVIGLGGTFQPRTIEVYAEVLAQRDDLTGRASFDAAALFFKNAVGSDLTQDGSTSKPKIGSLAVDMQIAARVDDTGAWVDVQVQGLEGVTIHWKCNVQVRTRQDVVDYSGYPRLQMSIVGMKDGGFVSWNNLKDGINYVMVPTIYSSRFEHPPTWTSYRRTEHWNMYTLKDFGHHVMGSDWLNIYASRQGNTSTWTFSLSRYNIGWATNRNGQTSLHTYSTYRYYSTGVNGGIRKRMLSRQVQLAGVTFLWGRHDVRGWLNYNGVYM